MVNSLHKKAMVTSKSIVTALLVSATYLILSLWLVGFKTDQIVLVVLFNLLYFSTAGTRKFILGFSIFLVYWIIFDFMKGFPNYWFNPVSIEELYNAEKKWFGFMYNGSWVTPNEYYVVNTNRFLDVLTGVFYLCWVPVPLLFATWLFFKNKILFLQFSLAFLLVNLIGFIVYYIYPAAPPWYVQLHGFNFIAETPGNTAGLSRFDSFFGITLFHSMYSKSSNVFAAMPSLHSAYPVIVLFYGLKVGKKILSIVFAIVVAGIWFSAVYTSHHYILDVLAGLMCAILTILLMEFYFLKVKWSSKAIQKYLITIS